MRNFRVPLRLFCFAAITSWVVAAQAETLTIPGSGNPEFLLSRLAAAFNASQNDHEVMIPTSVGTAGALRDIALGEATLARVGRPLKGDELKLGLVFHSLGRDPVVLVAGAGVALPGVTSDQVVAIYRGELTDWSELGGPKAPIRAIGREKGDASFGVIMRHIPALRDMVYGTDVKVVHLDPEMVALLDRFPTSIGALNRTALFACATAVKPLALDGVEASVENLSAGRYPMWLEFGLIHRPDGLTPAGIAFLDFIRSPTGERVRRELGVPPPTDAGR